MCRYYGVLVLSSLLQLERCFVMWRDSDLAGGFGGRGAISKSVRDLLPTRNPPSASSHTWPAELRTTYHTRTSQIISCF